MNKARYFGHHPDPDLFIMWQGDVFLQGDLITHNVRITVHLPIRFSVVGPLKSSSITFNPFTVSSIGALPGSGILTLVNSFF